MKRRQTLLWYVFFKSVICPKFLWRYSFEFVDLYLIISGYEPRQAYINNSENIMDGMFAEKRTKIMLWIFFWIFLSFGLSFTWDIVEIWHILFHKFVLNI